MNYTEPHVEFSTELYDEPFDEHPYTARANVTCDIFQVLEPLGRSILLHSGAKVLVVLHEGGYVGVTGTYVPKGILWCNTDTPDLDFSEPLSYEHFHATICKLKREGLRVALEQPSFFSKVKTWFKSLKWA